MNSTPITPFWAKLAAGLASLVAAGFLTWAAVVWQRTDQIVTTWQQVLERVIVAETRVVHIQEQLIEIVRASQRHEDSAWHDEAGARLQRLQAEIEAIRRQLERERERVGGARAGSDRISAVVTVQNCTFNSYLSKYNRDHFFTLFIPRKWYVREAGLCNRDRMWNAAWGSHWAKP